MSFLNQDSPKHHLSSPRTPSQLKDGVIVKMSLDPKPYQKPYPPLRMLMTSEPSFQEGAELGLKGWVWVQPPQRLRQRLEVYAGIRSAAGRTKVQDRRGCWCLADGICGTLIRGSETRHRRVLYPHYEICMCSNRPQDYYPG